MLIMEHVAYATYGTCRASDRSTAVKILDRRAAIGSLRCSDEPVVPALQGLCQCWSFACLLLNFIENNAHRKQSIKTYIKTVNRRSVNKKTVNKPEQVL